MSVGLAQHPAVSTSSSASPMEVQSESPVLPVPSSSGSESVASGPVPATLSGHGDNMCTSFAEREWSERGSDQR